MALRALEAGARVAGKSWIGYRVDSPAGRLGTVVGTFWADGDAISPLLAVGLGRDGRRIHLFPLGDVAIVDSRRRVVALSRVRPQGDECVREDVGSLRAETA